MHAGLGERWRRQAGHEAHHRCSIAFNTWTSLYTIEKPAAPCSWPCRTRRAALVSQGAVVALSQVWSQTQPVLSLDLQPAPPTQHRATCRRRPAAAATARACPHPSTLPFPPPFCACSCQSDLPTCGRGCGRSRRVPQRSCTAPMLGATPLRSAPPHCLQTLGPCLLVPSLLPATRVLSRPRCPCSHPQNAALQANMATLAAELLGLQVRHTP